MPISEATVLSPAHGQLKIHGHVIGITAARAEWAFTSKETPHKGKAIDAHSY
jgi:hypothetical protein